MHFWPISSISKGARLIIVLAITLLLVAVSLLIGVADLSWRDIAKVFLGRGDAASTQIIWLVRLPRTLAALLAGSALAVAGCILQAVLNNAIASPNLIGVNAGSGLFSLLVIVFCPQLYMLMPVSAFTGAMLASLFVFYLGYRAGASRLTVILAGVAVSSLLSAFSDTIIILFPDAQISRTSFMIGGLAGVARQTLQSAAAPIILGLVLAALLSYDLNVLALGDETASGLGLHVNRTRLVYLAIAALLAASAVSIAGLIGFVGLLIPHLARFLFGNDHRTLIPASALLGAGFLLACDLAARTLFAPFELPVGIILSFLGAPFFIYLLIKQKRGRLHD